MNDITRPLLTLNQLEDFYYEGVSNIKSQIEEMQERGSGLVLKEIIQLDLDLKKYRPHKGGSYIKTPFKSNTIINVQNVGDVNELNKCPIWVLIAYTYLQLNLPKLEHPERMSSYSG